MKKLDSTRVSRRQLIQRSAMAAGALPLLSSLIGNAQAAQAPGGAQAPAAGRGAGRGPAAWGNGPIKVLLITAFHPYDRGPFFDMFDSFGKEITWTHVDQPAAEMFLNPEMAEPYDVFVNYDCSMGSVRQPRVEGAPAPAPVYTEPSPKVKAGLKALMQNGNKGFVWFHHSIASWVHSWPEYVEMMGGACDWGQPLKNIRGKDYPFSGFRDDVQQHVTVVDKTHPITQGLGDGFDIKDEAYLCPMFEDSVHCLTRTDFVAKKENFPMQMGRDPNWNPPQASNMTSWVKVVEKSPFVYIEHGHGPNAWTNPSFKTLLMLT